MSRALTIALKAVERMGPKSRPWRALYSRGKAELQTYNKRSEIWETVLTTNKVKYTNPHVVAALVLRAVNSYDEHRALIEDLVTTLELCLACDGLSWEAEHDATILCARVRERFGAESLATS